jgi:hypothetical protein
MTISGPVGLKKSITIFSAMLIRCSPF